MKTGNVIKQTIAKSLLRSLGIDHKELAKLAGLDLSAAQKSPDMDINEFFRSAGLDPKTLGYNEQLLLRMNSKVLATQLAKERLALASVEEPVQPEAVSLGWRPTTEGDLTSNWCRWWLKELQHDFVMHRKCWEYGWALQELFAAGLMKEGARGLGFGCGKEPLSSYFAKKGMSAVITDLDPSAGQSEDWSETNQHASSLRDGFYESLVSWEQYQKLVEHRFADMTDIPDDLKDFDFCWSICSLEHLGSIDAGLQFVENSLKTLRPGGIAVHTTEYNCLDKVNTVETGGSVIFREKDFEALAGRLRASGHKVGKIEYDTGKNTFDRFVDLEPYDLSTRGAALRDYFGDVTQGGHLRMTIGGHVSPS